MSKKPGEGSACSVTICKNYYRKARVKGKCIIFFTFPKKSEIRKQWIAKCYRKDKPNANNTKICNRHFTSGVYEDYIQARLMGDKPPRKLKKNGGFI